MLSYLIRRLLLLPPTLLGVTVLVFFVMGISPGGVGGSLADAAGNMEAEARKALEDYYNKRYGLDKPLHVQYLRWVNQISPVGFRVDDEGNLGQFGFKPMDFGYSWSKGRPVLELWGETLPVTLMLNLLSIPIIYTLAIFSGIFAARKPRGTFDLATGGGYMILWCVPAIWAGVMLIGFFASKNFLEWFPTGQLHHHDADAMAFLPSWSSGQFQRGWLLDMLWHMVLPIICLSYGGLAFLSRLTRSAVLDNLNADYARTARAKGLPERQVLFRHVLRNSLLPLITVLAHILPALLAGSVVVETIFSIQGMGRLSFEAVMRKDRELIMAQTFIAGFIGLMSLLLADICYAIADPRVSYE